MNKNMLLAASAILLSFSALTVSADEAKKGDKKSAPSEIQCSVMASNKVNIAEATKKGAGKGYADYKGNRYFFCCGCCPAEFAKDPTKFAKSAHIKTPKVSKTDKPNTDKPKAG